jgi:uncharacterized repeat protein (TIGR03803 family)
MLEGNGVVWLMLNKIMNFRILTALALLTAAAPAMPLSAGTVYSVVGNPVFSGAYSPRGALIFSGGYLFGASTHGGANGVGSIYRFDPASGSFQINHSFAMDNGGVNPSSGILVGSDTKLYGVNFGGVNGEGTLFRIDQPGNTFETLRPFALASGGTPDGPPIQAADGKLYGVTGTGGANGFGGIYQVNVNGTGYSLIHEFTGTTGSRRGKGEFCRGLVEGPGGMLYGCTNLGGNATDTGMFFVASTNGTTYNFMHAFDGPGFTKPSNQLLLASDGFFYGAASEGGNGNVGGIFRIAANGDYTELHHFSNGLDGYSVISPLIEGSDGRLYGCASYSSTGWGSVFRMSKDGTNFAVLHRFSDESTDGLQPGGPLLETANGVFYGTTTAGGANLAGTIFKIETTLETPVVQVTGKTRPTFRGNTLRLSGTASDDLAVARVEYLTKGGYKSAEGTTAWNARIKVKPSTKRVTVQVRSSDGDGLFSPVSTIRARRKS